EQAHDGRFLVEVERRADVAEIRAELRRVAQGISLEEGVVRAEVESLEKIRSQRVAERVGGEPALVRLLRALEVPRERRERQVQDADLPRALRVRHVRIAALL